MAGAFSCGKQYIYLSNNRCSSLIEGAIEVGKQMCQSDEHKEIVSKMDTWWQKCSYPGVDISLEERFPTVAEQKFWALTFQELAWRVFYRRWGNQQNETWQVDYIAACYVITRMLTGLVWQEDRQWYPAREDTDGIRPDPMRIQQ